MVLSDTKISEPLRFQMQSCVIFWLLLSSGVVIGNFENVLKRAEFIADIYQKLPPSCIFLIISAEQQEGEN
jgi:hypothetical protein